MSVGLMKSALGSFIPNRVHSLSRESAQGFATLRDISRKLDSGAAERHRKQLRVLSLLVSLPASIVSVVYLCSGLSLLQGIETFRAHASGENFVAEYVRVPHTFWDFVAPLSIAMLCAVATVIGIWLNWKLRARDSYADADDVKMINGLWGGIFGICFFMGGLISAFTVTDSGNGALNEAVDNWLVTTQHVSSDTDYAKTAHASRDFLTRNVDGQWVYFTVKTEADKVAVHLHDGPQGIH